jgi:hypothetical protein
LIDLQIKQQFGRIGLDITPYRFAMQVTSPEVKIEQSAAEVDIIPAELSLTVDYTQFKASIGLRNMEDNLQHYVNEAKAAYHQGVERTVSEGNLLSDLSKRISIGQLAKSRLEPKEKRLVMESTAPVDFHVDYKPLSLNVKMGEVNVETVLGSVKGSFEFGSVRTYWEQEPKLEIHAVGNLIDVKK